MIKQLNLWQTLNHEQRQQITVVIARLIQEIVCPKKGKQTREVSNEQQR